MSRGSTNLAFRSSAILSITRESRNARRDGGRARLPLVNWSGVCTMNRPAGATQFAGRRPAPVGQVVAGSGSGEGRNVNDGVSAPSPKSPAISRWTLSDLMTTAAAASSSAPMTASQEFIVVVFFVLEERPHRSDWDGALQSVRRMALGEWALGVPGWDSATLDAPRGPPNRSGRSCLQLASR